MSVKVVRTLVEENGFRLVYDRPFMLWLNHLYVFGKEVKPTEDRIQIQKIIKEEIRQQ
jgi:predicted metalloprotease